MKFRHTKKKAYFCRLKITRMSIRMKRKYIYPLLATLFLPTFLTSCVKDNDETTELSEQCYISASALGNLKRSMYGKTSAGMDSIYTATYSGAAFPMIIDHRNLIIENNDSLLVRSRLDRVTVSVSFVGTLTWRKANPTTEEEEKWTAYNSKDSLNLTEPLHFRVFSETGNSSRTYTLKVNVHQQNGDSTTWDNLGAVAELAEIKDRRVAMVREVLTIVGQNSSDELVCVQHPNTLDGEWTLNSTTGAAGAKPSTLQQQGDKLVMSTSGGSIVESDNGIDWNTTSYPTRSGLTLVAASLDRLYALCEGKLVSSDGGEWVEEQLDDEAANLPTDNLNGVFYVSKNTMHRLFLIGRRNADDKEATIWCKTWAEQENDANWMYYTPNQTDLYRCPMLENLSVVAYDNGMQAFGGALSEILHSGDNGVTWKTYDNNDMLVDEALQKVAKKAKYLAATADNEHFLWMILDDNVWRGRINRLGFEK